ncbi:MAG: hypothetical protein O3A82_02665 [Verrucomicrobia bacterium]|jgi:hypothetical protein|nr:hypothetical protein [Verrucomicrobiota bacterium]MDA0724746.1 hypothetical protein [Verrucomicrobiota bacterium]MDA1045812.1 hypothetical protein [Verrucomicrobiota bacterium]
MEEVYETRFEELGKWIGEKKQLITDCQAKLKNDPNDRDTLSSLKKQKHLWLGSTRLWSKFGTIKNRIDGFRAGGNVLLVQLQMKY